MRKDKSAMTKTPSLMVSTAYVLAASNVGNFFAYLFQLLSGRILSVGDYAALVSLLSLQSMLGLPQTVFGTALVKIASEVGSKGEGRFMSELYIRLLKIVSGFGLVMIILLVGLRNNLAVFLQLDDPNLLVVLAFFLATSVFFSLLIYFLQGQLAFKKYAFLSIFTAAARLIFGVGVGYALGRVLGSLLGLLLGALIALGMGLYLVRDIWQGERQDGQEVSEYLSKIWRFSLPTALMTISLAVLFNLDVVLVKHFFPPEKAGLYAGVAIVGRILYFGVASISQVMFPLVSAQQASGGKPRQVFLKLIALVAALLVVGMVVFNLAPQLLVGILFGEGYLAAAPYLRPFSWFIASYTLLTFFSQYFLSTYQLAVGRLLIVGSALYPALLFRFHGSLEEVISVATAVSTALLIVSLGYFFRRGAAV